MLGAKAEEFTKEEVEEALLKRCNVNNCRFHVEINDNKITQIGVIFIGEQPDSVEIRNNAIVWLASENKYELGSALQATYGEIISARNPRFRP